MYIALSIGESQLEVHGVAWRTISYLTPGRCPRICGATRA